MKEDVLLRRTPLLRAVAIAGGSYDPPADEERPPAKPAHPDASSPGNRRPQNGRIQR